MNKNYKDMKKDKVLNLGKQDKEIGQQKKRDKNKQG